MKQLIKLIAGVAVLTGAQLVNAGVINFVDLTENATTGYGESAWTSLNLSSGGSNVSITGHSATGQTFAYLDWNHAGLGACKQVLNASKVNTASKGSSLNNCDPGSDDNVSAGEFVRFVFDTDTVISKIWLNNSHDGGFTAASLVNINGNTFTPMEGYAGGANGIGSFNVAKGQYFDIAYNNVKFYVSAIEFQKASVPESSSFILLGLGLLGLVATRRRQQG